MKTLFLILLTCCLFPPSPAQGQASPAQGQSSPSKGYSISTALFQKANDFWQHKQIDSALACYQTLSTIDFAFDPAYTLDMLALCHLAKGDTTKAEASLLECLSTDRKRDVMGIRQQASIALADLYTSQHRYREALYYIDSSQTLFAPVMKQCDGGFGWMRDLVLSYKKALCYNGLDEKDSAITILTPHAFYAPFNRDDSLYLAKMYTFYVKLLIKKYGKEKVKAELTRAMNYVYYEDTDKHLADTGIQKELSRDEHVGCGISFFNIPVVFCDQEYWYPKDTTHVLSSTLPKTYFVSQAKRSPTYRMIMTN